MSDAKEGAYRTADLLKLFTAVGIPPTVAKGSDIPRFPDIYTVTDLEKTEIEKRAIEETIASLNAVRSAFLPGSAPLRFDPTTIHIVAGDEFDAKIGIPGRDIGGKSWLGHVYVPRRYPTWKFQAILAHELMHAAAYLWVEVRTNTTRKDGAITWPKIIERRCGMVLIDPSYGTFLPHFHGLNEMVTETAAHFVRQHLATCTSLLDGAERSILKTFLCSPPLVTFMNTLLECMGDAAMDAWRMVIRDYTDGTDTFLRLLEPHLPGATERLRRTGAQPHELLPAAEELGLTKLAESIRPYCA